MGEEAKQEAGAAEAKAEEKKEEKAEEKKEEKPEEKKDEPPLPPPPFVLYVDLHCTGCAKKIERSIMKLRGVEEVAIDMAQNQVTIKGIVEPQAVCMKIMKRTRRSAKVVSPLPAAEGEPMPEVVTSQVSGPTTVELNVNMHCEACAAQLKRKILKMRGVRTAETELSTGKVTVTGTMEANRLVDYVYRRTKKLAQIVPQPEPEKPPEENKEGDKPAEEPKPEDKKEENVEKKADEEKPKEEANKEGGEKGPDAGENKDEKGGDAKEEAAKKEAENNSNIEEEMMMRMMYHYQPVYVIERIPPPQLFSDENPNACCIS